MSTPPAVQFQFADSSEDDTPMTTPHTPRLDPGAARGLNRRPLVRIAWVAAIAAVTASAPLTVGAQFGFGDSGELELVARFDKNGDKRLDAAERKAARSVAASQGGGFRRFGFGGASSPARPGPRLSPADVRSYPPSTGLYDLGAVRTIFLQFESADWEDELSDFHNTDVEVPATMTVDGQTFKDVGVHFRGASSYAMVPEGYKRSLNLSLDFVHEKQLLGGYRTLNLLNANSDPTFLRAVLYTEISRRYIPTPRMNYVRVVINGQSWGIYLNAQQFNRDFTRDYFDTTEGARWKVPGSPRGMGGLEYLGDMPDAYKQLYEIKTKDTQKSWSDLMRMTRILNETPAARLESALQGVLDVDGVLKFLAIEVALVNTDGYWSRASDFNIFQDPKGVFHIVPHDVNEGMGAGGGGGFGRRGFGGGGTELEPLVSADDPSKPLYSQLLAVPALRARYLAYVRDIAEEHLDWKTLGPRAQQLHALIAEDVKADTRKLYGTDQFESGLASIQSFVERRRAFLLKP
jgi:hypothetical protein